MGKTKSKRAKKASSDAIYAKKRVKIAKANPFTTSDMGSGRECKVINPFDVHLNREKFKILGRVCKHDKGLPGVSRAKALKKRKETIGQEYLERHKNNQFCDRRIGGDLANADLNEPVLNARFLAEKMSQFRQKKMSRFDLNDDEVLTHRGQTLEEIEQFRDDPKSDDDCDDEELNANYTEMLQFGGDLSQSKNRKIAIGEMIAEQKRRKVEIIKDKAEVLNMTERLDSNLRNLMESLSKAHRNEPPAKSNLEDYDRIVREMIYEPRGEGANKLSVEESARREKEQLDRLEKERLARMSADVHTEAQKKPKHRSADDLDDGYFNCIEELEETTLAYNLDGSLKRQLVAKNEVNVNNEGGQTDKAEFVNNSESVKDAEMEETSDDESSDSDNEDNLSDLKQSDSDSEADHNKDVQKMAFEATKELQPVELLKPIKESQCLPSLATLEMPRSYKCFKSLITSHASEMQAVIVERLIKFNHPKLEPEVNREKLIALYKYILQYADELFKNCAHGNVSSSFKTISELSPYIYDIAHLIPEKATLTVLEIIKEKYLEFQRNPKQYPSLEVCVFFKLISNVYSTSDFRHSVVTPCFIFMQHVLSRARVRTCRDVAMGHFIVAILLEMTKKSQRFMPAMWNYLHDVICLAIPTTTVSDKSLRPHQSFLNRLLVLAEKDDGMSDIPPTEECMQSEDLINATSSASFKIRALNITLKLLTDAVVIVGGNVGANYMASSLLRVLKHLPLDLYPDYVHNNFLKAKDALECVAVKPVIRLRPPEKRPKALRLLEPRFESVYDDKRRPKMTKEKEERGKLLHKVKRETKGAVRELRRDTQFLQKMKLKQQMQSDLERKEKLKRIYQEASIQQGELNKIARSKKKF